MNNEMIKKIEDRIVQLKESNRQIAKWIVEHVETDTNNDGNCLNLLANENKIRELRLVIAELKK